MNISDDQRGSVQPTLTDNGFASFTYSRRQHFETLRIPPFHLGKDIDNCDLKVYQDMVIFNYLLSTFPPGACILEIGGGFSRIIAALSTYFRFCNLDKYEGIGNGTKHVQTIPGVRMVYDYIGNFSAELPGNYFDCVFSISVLEHVDQDAMTCRNITDDIRRILKPGGRSVHCIDILRHKEEVWMHPIIDYFYRAEQVINPRVEPAVILGDMGSYGMSEQAYNRNWLPSMGVSYAEGGVPMSYNLVWRKQ